MTRTAATIVVSLALLTAGFTVGTSSFQGAEAGVAVAFLSLGAAPAVAQNLPSVKDLPAGVKKNSGVVPAMGEHWSRAEDRGKGPLFGVMNGKVVFYEFEYLSKSVEGPKEWDEDYKYPAFLPKPDHTHFGYLPKGHRNMEVPHFVVHMYFVPHKVHMAYKPKRRGRR